MPDAQLTQAQLTRAQLTRTMRLDRSSADAQQRTVAASLSSETPIGRNGETEVLSHEASAVDLSRCANGLPLLFNHNRDEPIGIVENVRLENRRLVGTLRFGRSARAAEVWADVEAGTLNNVSISYSVQAGAPIDGGVMYTRWTPFETSIVSVPADASVGIGRAAPLPEAPSHLNGYRAMPDATTTTATPQTAAPTQAAAPDAALINRAADITTLCMRHGVGDMAAGLIRGSGTLEAAQTAVGAELARRDAAAGGHLNVRRGTHAVRTGEADTQSLMVEALAARMGGPAAQRGNPFINVPLSGMARDLLERSGVPTTTLSTPQLIERSLGGLHTTSDFPALLTGAGERVLRAAYGAYQGGLRRVARASTARDFRAKQRLALSEAPALLKVNEHGEFHSGAMTEAKTSYALATYGRIFGISRQALINDDLDAFGQMAARFGRAASEFESGFLVNLLASNPLMSDGLALFHASHGNLSDGPLAEASLSAARLAMRLQTGLDGKTPIDATPRFLIVPAALETAAEKLLATIQPTHSADVNPFSGKLELVVDPRLDVVSPTAWYLATDPGLIDTLEYSYLETEAGPTITTREGFEVDGLQMRVRLDYGAAVLDWRGLYRSAGA